MSVPPLPRPSVSSVFSAAINRVPEKRQPLFWELEHSKERHKTPVLSPTFLVGKRGMSAERKTVKMSCNGEQSRKGAPVGGCGWGTEEPP